jgi:hypothetical protein
MNKNKNVNISLKNVSGGSISVPDGINNKGNIYIVDDSILNQKMYVKNITDNFSRFG